MRTQNFFLSKIRLLGALCLASLSVLIAGCAADDVFTSDKSVVEEAKSSAPLFNNSIDPNSIWDNVKTAWGLSDQMNCVPVVIYDDLMNPRNFETLGKSLWNTAVNVDRAKRIFNYDSRQDKKDKTAKNYADLNALSLDLGNSKEDSDFSAVLYGVDQKTFSSLCKHYAHHGLVPVVVSKQNNDTTVYSLGFMFSVTNPDLLTPQDVLPNRERFLSIWNSINSEDVTSLYGMQFPADYINTTFLADGESINSLIPPLSSHNK
ncbi:hypothetical protein [Chlamydia felis Fe/C-56]|uniref:Lipoprotein n=1 Tax=Chlamydia felis (strain Fe/C-56) TaxID=264202 RepID=Q254U2_CHLFF|nr:hypothetical protein [Chlamydia felis]BAE81196.1 hypothetical protein [Chlamydia felis Fe/C-56]